MARYLDPELHELVSHLRSELSEQNSEMRALQAENEQLRDDATAYAEILADKQRHYDTLSKNAEQLFDQRTELLLKVNTQDSEIERLRGLLRDVDDGLDDYWITTKEGVAWICRRSEALG